MLDNAFQISRRGSTPRREVIGGITSFVTMAYIIVANPAILSVAGIPIGFGNVATILPAAFGSLLMGIYANPPIAVAPYMGENAFTNSNGLTAGLVLAVLCLAYFLFGLPH